MRKDRHYTAPINGPFFKAKQPTPNTLHHWGRLRRSTDLPHIPNNKKSDFSRTHCVKRKGRGAVGRILPKPTPLISECTLADEEGPSPYRSHQWAFLQSETAHTEHSSSQGSASAKHRPTSYSRQQSTERKSDFSRTHCVKRKGRDAVGRVLPKPTPLISECTLADEERLSPYRSHQWAFLQSETAHTEHSSSQGSASAKHRPTSYSRQQSTERKSDFSRTHCVKRKGRDAVGRFLPKPTPLISECTLADEERPSLYRTYQWAFLQSETAHPEHSSSQGSASAKHRPTAYSRQQSTERKSDFSRTHCVKRKGRDAVGRVLPKPTPLISECTLADEERLSPYRSHQWAFLQSETAHTEHSSSQGSASAKHRPTAYSRQ